jgi:hypothetical protein
VHLRVKRDRYLNLLASAGRHIANRSNPDSIEGARRMTLRMSKDRATIGRALPQTDRAGYVLVRSLILAAVALVVIQSRAFADDKNSVPLPREQWPVSVPFDVPVADCEKMGGTLINPRRPLCQIVSANCAAHEGFIIVMRDAYITASSRLAACRKMH